MHQTFRLTFGMVFILTLSTGEALAEVLWRLRRRRRRDARRGNFARGGLLRARGGQVYNRDTAIANSIEQDAILRWNEYMFQSQQES